MKKEYPLAVFSYYLSGRNQVLLSIAKEIIENLDASVSNVNINRERASNLMWLWILGAYEVSRTMCQAKDSFSEVFYKKISGLKTDLEKVRVPNTKMEKIQYNRRERPVPVTSNREPDEWDETKKDLLIGDPSAPASSRLLIESYVSVMTSLTSEDVIMTHEDSLKGS